MHGHKRRASQVIKELGRAAWPEGTTERVSL